MAAACYWSPTATASSSSCGASIWSPAPSETLTGHIPWDIESFARTDDGRFLAWVANVDGAEPAHRARHRARRTESLPPLPDGRIGRIAFDRAGKRLALSLESPQSPRDVFVLELERNAVVRYTKSEAGPIDPLQFAPAELVRFPTFDRENGKPAADSRVRLSPARTHPARTRYSSTSTAARNPRRSRASTRSRNSWCARWASW